MGVMNASSTIMIDLVPGQGSAVTACVSVLNPTSLQHNIHVSQLE
jgi:hypothetical protein